MCQGLTELILMSLVTISNAFSYLSNTKIRIMTTWCVSKKPLLGVLPRCAKGPREVQSTEMSPIVHKTSAVVRASTIIVKTVVKQECIPVGYVPARGVHAWRVYLPGGVPAGGVPAGGVPAGGCTCQRQYLHRYSPHLWTEWQTGAKILPCPKLCLRAVINRNFPH